MGMFSGGAAVGRRCIWFSCGRWEVKSGVQPLYVSGGGGAYDIHTTI